MTARSGRFTLIQQNDIHAQLDLHWEHFWANGTADYRRVGGLARAATVAGTIKRETGAALLVDCGDAIHGTLPALRTEGRAVVPALNAEGVDLLVPGNWEYGYGPEALRRRATEMRFPVLAANLRDATSGEPIFPGTMVREVGGVRIGFAGLTSAIIPNMSPRFAEGLRFTDARRVIPRVVEGLRTDEDCDIVVLVSHLGLPQDVALVREIDGVDVVLSGHTHNRLEQPVVAGGTIIIQSGFSGSFLGRLDLEVARGRIVGWRHELVELSESIEADAEVQAAVDEALGPFRDEAVEPVGRTAVALHRMGLLETPTDNLLVEAYRALTGAEVGLSHGWRFAPPVPAGTITLGDLWSMIPTNPEVRTALLSGRQILALIEGNLHNVFAGDALQQSGGYVIRASGLGVVFRPNNGRGARVEHLEIAGEPYRPDRVYTVAEAGVRDLPESVEREGTGIGAIEAIRRYLAAGEVRPEVTGRTFIAQ
jgi:S-sulfosulfanyl-L-cysteine sulfohydrolase